MLNSCYKKAGSKDEFYLLIGECDLTTYIRGGRISGVIYSNKKFRINRLGFTEERLQELNKTINRNKEIGELRRNNELNNSRQKGNQRIINLNR